MYTPKKAYFYGTGRRKSSVARVRLFPGGTGEIKKNHKKTNKTHSPPPPPPPPPQPRLRLPDPRSAYEGT